jgi:putative transcriptional regulator
MNDSLSSDRIDVTAIRKKAGRIGRTQRSFATALGVSVKTLRNWEQRRRRPTGPALVLLALVQREPLLIAHVLQSDQRSNLADQLYFRDPKSRITGPR